MRLPRVEITYCTQCRWMLRSVWYLQELLVTFGDILGEATLIPSTGGVFEIRVQTAHDRSELIWDRRRDGGFPDVKWLKQQVRDRIAPDMSLGHSDQPQREGEAN
ncbi:MAG: hypothetical protein KatS3mg111_2370 [Pirellulaceae bacterium]|nr:MAG: hypothetical protein KatS3mg111_2370 [Pirellulaceae bacterium]